MNIFQQRFSTGQVVAATGLPNATLQSWLKRDLIVGHKQYAPIQGGGSPGAHRGFSFFNVMEIAIAKALLDAGMGSVSDACKAAMGFAHVGNGQIGDMRPERRPGLPYNDACLTVLCVRQENSVVEIWKPKSDLFITARHRLGEGFVVLEINPIFERVTHRLGHDYRDVLNFAYSVGDNS